MRIRLIVTLLASSALFAPAVDADVLGLLAERSHTCGFRPIACNQTLSGTLTTHDCFVTAGVFADFLTFNGTTGMAVTIDVGSLDFDTFAALFGPNDEALSDDDGGPGTDSRIVTTLTSTGEWVIGVANFFEDELGDYTVRLTCPGGGGGSPPAAPSALTATAMSDDRIDLDWTDNANNETGYRVEMKEGSGSFVELSPELPANASGATVSGLDPATPYTFRVRARNGAGFSAYSNQATATTFGGSGPCIANATALCLSNGRFKVQATFQTGTGQSGQAQVVQLTPDTGYLWFFTASNVEAVVKVLNACALNNRYWVFAGGLTDVQVVMTVTDTQTGAARTYTNPLGTKYAPVQDTSAFATCP